MENKYVYLGTGDAFVDASGDVSGDNSDSSTSDPALEVPAYWHLDRLDQGSLPLDKTFTVNNLTGENVDVYILDSGIHYEHADFNGRALYPGCDPIDKINHQNQAGRDCEGHGTHVAGLVGGNGTGVTNNVTLYSVRILDCNLVASVASLVQGLMCVVDHHKTRNGTRAIINLSIAGLQTTKAINDALQSALDNNILIAAAAGNGRDSPRDPYRIINYDACKVYPAAYPGVITVGATDMHDEALMGEFDNRTFITNMGKCVDVFAPGYDILSSGLCPIRNCNSNSKGCIAGMMYNNTCRESRTGTSQSTPLVVGSIALLLEKCPNLTNAQVQHLLKHSLSTDKVEFSKAIQFAITIFQSSAQIGVLDTVLSSPDRLLYIGNALESITNCTIILP